MTHGQPTSELRTAFIQRLGQLPIKPKAISHYARWAESWTKARGQQSSERTLAYFDALGRSAHLADWQFRQAVDAARILACDVLAIPWASSFDWQGLSDQAHSLEPDHRTLARESIRVSAGIPPQPSQSGPLPATDEEIARITDNLRRTIRLIGHAYATEETYVYWAIRFTRFCLIKLRQTPKNAVPNAITAYLDYLALERNVSPATQSQALNALAFLTKNVLGLREFTLDHITPARGQRRPPVVMTRQEVRSVIACLEDPWKLAAQLMYGSGLRLAETLRLRVKDLDFGQASSHEWDYARASHHYVPLRLSTRQH